MGKPTKEAQPMAGSPSDGATLEGLNRMEEGVRG